MSHSITSTITDSTDGTDHATDGPSAGPDPTASPSAHRVESADVIVVGAGPSGSATAAYLAMAGLDVLLLEKSAFPREKVCGDGLTPRAVRELITLGIPTPAEDGWIKNHGLRIVGGGHRLELPWPDLASFPPYGLVRARKDFDDILAKHAVKHGARLRESTNVTGPILDERTGAIIGVLAKAMDPDGKPTGEDLEFRAPLVVAADGNSSRLSMSMHRPKRDDRPMGVAVRTYYTSPRHDDDYLESWLELWSKDPQTGKKVLLPGYGWIFGVGDGTSNVGLGILNTSSAFGKVDYKDILSRWVETLPPEWTFNDATMTSPVRGAALPMGFNRQPHYDLGLLLVGDAGGMINLQSYPRVMKDALGGYYTLGRGFAKMIGHPEVMRLAVKYGLPRTTMMRFLLKIMANLAEPHGGDASDRLINALSKMAPAA